MKDGDITDINNNHSYRDLIMIIIITIIIINRD